MKEDINKKLQEQEWLLIEDGETKKRVEMDKSVVIKTTDALDLKRNPDYRKEPTNYYLRNLGDKIVKPLSEALRLIEKNEFRIEGLDDEVMILRAMALCYLQKNEKSKIDENDWDTEEVDNAGLTPTQYKRFMAIQEQIRKTVETANRIKEEVIFGHKEIKKFIDAIFRVIIDSVDDRKLADKIITNILSTCILTVKKISQDQQI